MERLTYWCGDGAGGGEWRINADGKEYSGPEVDRLAAYESTGQEPGDVLSATDMGKIACALHELNQYKELETLDRLRGAVENLAEAEARAEEAEAALAAAVGDMEAIALTIRRRTDYDTECCPFCRYDGPAEDYCPGWEEDEDEEEPCFRWRGADRSRKPTGDLSRDPTKMVPLTLEQLRRRVEKARRPVVVFVVTIDPDTGERDFDGEWEMFDGDDFVADGTWDTYANYGVTFEAYGRPPKPLPERG